jgi:hypothetical protein
MGKKQQKSKAIAFTFRPFLRLFPFFINGQKQQKSNAIAFSFRPFLATFPIFHKWAKNSKKVRLFFIIIIKLYLHDLFTGIAKREYITINGK